MRWDQQIGLVSKAIWPLRFYCWKGKKGMSISDRSKGRSAVWYVYIIWSSQSSSLGQVKTQIRWDPIAAFPLSFRLWTFDQVGGSKWPADVGLFNFGKTNTSPPPLPLTPFLSFHLGFGSWRRSGHVGIRWVLHWQHESMIQGSFWSRGREG